MMPPPRCRLCMAEDLERIARRQRGGDRITLMNVVVDLRNRSGCVHLAVQGTGEILGGLWVWTACGHGGDRLCMCARVEHVNCELCQRKAAAAMKQQRESEERTALVRAETEE